MKRIFVPLATAALCASALNGCPPPQDLPVPPFDATGVYAGSWNGNTTSGSAKEQVVQECPLEFTLTQDVDAPWPQRFAVTGSAVVDYSCFDLPEWAETPPPSEIQVAGVMDEQGHVGLVSAACGTGMCVALGLDGPGVDADGDGLMDSFQGEWQYSLLLAGFTPFVIHGNFEAAAAMYE